MSKKATSSSSAQIEAILREVRELPCWQVSDSTSFRKVETTHCLCSHFGCVCEHSFQELLNRLVPVGGRVGAVESDEQLEGCHLVEAVFPRDLHRDHGTSKKRANCQAIVTTE